MNYKSANL